MSEAWNLEFVTSKINTWSLWWEGGTSLMCERRSGSMKPKKDTSSPKHMRRSIGRGCRGGGDCVRVSQRIGAHSICKSASTAVDAAAAPGPAGARRHGWKRSCWAAGRRGRSRRPTWQGRRCWGLPAGSCSRRGLPASVGRDEAEFVTSTGATTVAAWSTRGGGVSRSAGDN